MSKMKTLKDLLIDELKDLYSAEKQIVQNLPKIAKAASNDKLRAAFEEHTEQSKEHMTRLEQACKLLGEEPTGKTCKAMQGLIEEAKEVLEEEAEPEVKDAALIACAQRVEHYEIAGYGCVRTYARRLDLSQIKVLLQKTLDEEGQTDKLLTEIAENYVNPQAETARKEAVSAKK